MKLLKTIISIALLVAICVLPSVACPIGCTGSEVTQYAKSGASVTVALSGTPDPLVKYQWVVRDDSSSHVQVDSLKWEGLGATYATYTFTAPTKPEVYWIVLTATSTVDDSCPTVKCIKLTVIPPCPVFSLRFCEGSTSVVGFTYVPVSDTPTVTWYHKSHSSGTWITDPGHSYTDSIPYSTLTAAASPYDVKLELSYPATNGAIIKTCETDSAVTVTAVPSATFTCTTGCSATNN